MNLRELDYLVAVADHLHFGKAAQHCHVSQPTLSMQLRKLEAYLGVQLIERLANKKVMLTAIGRELVKRARRIRQEVEEMKAEARSSLSPFIGELKLGLFPTLAPYLLPWVVPEMKRHFPKVNLILVEEKTNEIIHQLENGGLDCAMLAMPINHPTLACAPLFDEPFYLAVPPQHRFAKRQQVTLGDLQFEDILLLDEGHCLRDQALKLCQTIGVGEAKTFRATSLETLRHMVASGGGVTFMPRYAVQFHSETVRYIPFEAPMPSRRIGLFWRKGNGRQALYDHMVGHLQTPQTRN